MTRSLSLLFFVPLLLAGCNGVRFADQTVNRSLPQDFTSRTMIKNTSDYRFEMAQNIGAVLEEDPVNSGRYRLAATSVILPDNFTPTERLLIKEDNTVFQTKVTAGGEGSTNYATLGMSFSGKQAAELSIIDISRAEVPTPQIPAQKLATYAATKPARKQYWIKSLLLSRVLRQDYSEVKADAQGAGPAFGANGKVYSTNSQLSTDYALAALLIDIDSYKTVTPGQPPSPTVTGTDLLRGATPLGEVCAQARAESGSVKSIRPGCIPVPRR